jgi:hypothetical protein
MQYIGGTWSDTFTTATNATGTWYISADGNWSSAPAKPEPEPEPDEEVAFGGPNCRWLDKRVNEICEAWH